MAKNSLRSSTKRMCEALRTIAPSLLDDDDRDAALRLAASISAVTALMRAYDRVTLAAAEDL